MISADDSKSQAEVLVIGAGPVGLSLALALTSRGVAVAVFEQDEHLVKEIRASTFHAATMEKMAEWGVLESVLARGHRVDRLQFWDRQERRIVGDFDYSLIAGDTKYPFRLQCPQHVYAETLLERLADEPLATVHFGHKFLRHCDGAEQVTATFLTNAGERTYAGRLLCGADGASSGVRTALALGFEGMTYEDRFLLVGTNFDLRPYYPGIASVSYIFDPEEWVITLQLNDLLRIVFQVKEGASGEEELTDANIRARVWKFLGERVDFPILHRSIYRVHQRVADRFHVGRCLLLGDAAHINNPASGMGMNSGIMDAACLAEQIVQYFATGREAALANYDAVRRAYALNKIKTYTKQRYQDLSASDAAARAQRNKQYELMSQDPRRSRDFLLHSAMLEQRI